MKVVEDLFAVYGFQIEECEDIQKNVSYAKRLKEKI
jgi:hypothetical protein